MINDFARALARDPWPLFDIGYYLLGLLALTWGGNLACRLLLTWSGITLPPPEAAVVANLPAPSPAQSASPTCSTIRTLGADRMRYGISGRNRWREEAAPLARQFRR